MTTAGTMLDGRYELDHEIGRGGMGAVWLGRDTVLGRVVAVKQIGLGPGGGSLDVERAEREAHLAARVTHHHVVAIFDVIEHEGHRWLVMEHVEGTTLAGLVAARGALGDDAVAPVLHQVAGALAAAHGLGIVHRDVKPSNILIATDGTAKLSDFGIARAQADASLTRTGVLTGSPAYLAPEVATGGPATAASDMWSLGATMFHALAGHPPYDVGDNLLGALYRVVNEEPPRLDPSVRLAPLVTSMMQRDPADRPTMLEVEQAASPLLFTTSAATAAPVAGPDPDATQGFEAFADDPTPTATTAFRPLGPPVDPPTTAAPTAVTPAATTPGQDPSRRTLLAGAVVAVVAVAAVFLLTRGDDADPTVPGVSPTSEAAPATPGTSPSPTPDAGATPDGAVTAESLEGFAADYLSVASNDPEAGFDYLTPAYQDESGGLEGYEDFWGNVDDLDVQSVNGDPDALTVSYTYAYDVDGDRRTEDVTLVLEKSGDSFLIAGTA